MKIKQLLSAVLLLTAFIFLGCNPTVTSPTKPSESLKIENVRSASVSDSTSATVVLAWEANGSVILGCSQKAGNLTNEVYFTSDKTSFTVTGLKCSTEYNFYWKDSAGTVKTELKIKTPEAGKVELSEEEKETLFQERLLKYLTDAKKLEIFNEILSDEKKLEIFSEILTDEKKLEIFNEILSDEKKSEIFSEVLTDEKKLEIFNEILTDEKKLEIFNEILESKRSDGKFLELLTDEEKLEIFDEIYREKRTSAWIISQLTDEEMELILGSLTAEDLQMLLEALDTVPPAKATNFSATIVGDKIRLSWTDAADEDVLCYVIKYTKADAVRAVGFDAESIVVPQGRGYAYLNDLEDDTKYSFEIRAMDTTGNKSEKAQVECTVWKQEAEPLMDISSSYYNGVLLYISEDARPEEATDRYVLVNGKLVAQTDCFETNDDRYKETEWGYPYVKKGNTYTITVAYVKDGTILKEMDIDVKARSGLGEIKIVKQPVWKYEDYYVNFTQQPEVTVNGNPLSSTTANAVAQPYTLEDNSYFSPITFSGLSFEDIDIGAALAARQPENKVQLNLRYVFPSAKYGNYLYTFDIDGSKAFNIDWENYSPYLTFDKTYNGLKFSIGSSFVPENTMIREIYLNDKLIQQTYNPHAKDLTFAYPYVDKGKAYTIKIIYEDSSYSKIAELTQKVKAWEGQGEVTILTQPAFTVSDAGVRHTVKYPKIKIGNNEISGSTIPENGSYIATIGYGEYNWVSSRSWGDSTAWNYSGSDFPEDWDMAQVIAGTAQNGKNISFYHELYYEWADSEAETYGNYRVDFIVAKEQYFTVDWSKRPNSVWNAADDETVGLKIQYDLTNYNVSDYFFVLLYVDDMAITSINSETGSMEDPYVEAGKELKVELKGIRMDGSGITLGSPIYIVPESGLLTVHQMGEFTIDNDTGVLTVTKEPKVTIGNTTYDNGFMYAVGMYYNHGPINFDWTVGFTGFEYGVADYIFTRDDNPDSATSELKIKLAAARNMGTEENQVYCYIPFITTEHPDGFYDTDFNWESIPRSVEVITGEDVNGIKLNIKPTSIPAQATHTVVSVNGYDYGYYPVSQTEIIISNVVAGSTYDISVQYCKTDSGNGGSSFGVIQYYNFEATPVKGAVTVDGGSYSINKGVLNFTKPVIKLNGTEIENVRYSLNVNYKNPGTGEYFRDYEMNISNLAEGKRNLFTNRYDFYSGNNITDFEYTITARNDYDETPFAVVLANKEKFTMDWATLSGPYEIITEGVTGIKIILNEDYLPQNFTRYSFEIDDVTVIYNGTDKTIIYPDVMAGSKYQIKICLSTSSSWNTTDLEFEYTPETGNITRDSAGSYSMNNGLLKVETPAVIKRNGNKIDDVNYLVLYKLKYKDGYGYSNANSMDMNHKSVVNIFRSVPSDLSYYKEQYNGYAYKVYAYSSDSENPYLVPLMDDFVEETVDWDNLTKTYEDLSSEEEPGFKLKISQLEIPENAAYIYIFGDSSPILQTAVTEGDNIISYPYMDNLGIQTIFVHFKDASGNNLGESITAKVEVKKTYVYDIQKEAEVTFEDGKLLATVFPEISFSDNTFTYLSCKFKLTNKTESDEVTGPFAKDKNIDLSTYLNMSKFENYKVTLYAIYKKEINSKKYIYAYVPFKVFSNY